MARRAQSSIHPQQLLWLVLAIVVLGAIAYFGLGRTAPTQSFLQVQELSLQDYLANSNALSNNTYRFEGSIAERLDNWDHEKGRLFSVKILNGNQSSFLPVWIPSSFNAQNVQREQVFQFKVVVQAGTGILEVTDLRKS